MKPGTASIGATLLSMFDFIAAERPHEPALTAPDGFYTYGALAERSRLVAGGMSAEGLRPGERVVVALNRGADAVTAYLAAMRCGAAYVPIDPSYPAALRAELVGQCRPRFKVTSSGRTSVADWAERGVRPHLPPPRGTHSDDVAYAVFTSGSTGAPKGVEVAHRSVLNLLAGVEDRVPAPAPLRGAWWTSPAFDVAAWEVWSVLSRGGLLVVPPDDVRIDGHLYAGWLRDLAITNAYVAPAQLAELRDRVVSDPGGWSLSRLLVGTEPISLGLLQELRRNIAGLRILNGYGPSETTICATLYEVPQDGGDPALRAPIGTAIRGLRSVIAPTSADATVGELHISGDGVANGYMGQPTLTADLFRPAVGGGRAYRTGDLVRELPDGNLIYVGRADRQLKLNGFRIEPAEVERAVLKHAAVRECVVEVFEHADGGRALVAFVVADPPLDPGELRTHAATQLPPHAVPTVFRVMDAIPQTLNGKINRILLAKLAAVSAPDGDVRATTGSQADLDAGRVAVALLTACAEVLLVPPALDASFVEAGGTSLGASRAARSLRADLGREVSAADLLGTLTLSEVATRLAARPATALSVNTSAAARARVDWGRRRSSPLHPAQLGIWLDDTGADPLRYVEPVCFELRGVVDAERLCEAISLAAQRHPIAGAGVVSREGMPLLILGQYAQRTSRHDLTGLPHSQRNAWLRECAGRPFDLTREPVLRVDLARLQDDHCLLLLTWHHLGVDTWSLRLFLAALADAYLGRPLPADTTPTYCDIASWAAEHCRSDDVARRAAACAAALAHAPRYREAGPSAYPTADGYRFSPAEGALISALARTNGRTVAVAWLALAQLVLARRSRIGGLLMGVTASGRDNPETEDVAGCLVNPLLVQGLRDCDGLFPDAIRECGDELDHAGPNRDVPFGAVASHLLRLGGSRGARFPNVFIGFDETPVFDLGPDVRVTALPIALTRAKYEVTISFEQDSDGSVWCTTECLDDDPDNGAAALLAAVRREVAAVGRLRA